MKKHIHVPVWVKLTPNVTDIVEVGLAAQKSGADAVCAINTVRAMAIDIETGYPILGNRFGGMSGPAIKPVAIKCVYDLYLSLIHISEPTRLGMISYAVFCLTKKNYKQ